MGVWLVEMEYDPHERGVSGNETALKVKQFDLCPSARNKGWAEVVDVHFLLIGKC